MSLSEQPQFERMPKWSLPNEPKAFMAWLQNALPDDPDRVRTFLTYPAAQYMPFDLKHQIQNTLKYSDDEARDYQGRWTIGDAGPPDLEERAILQFGVTHDLSEAGYIAPSGIMLDFSGRSQAVGYHREGNQFVPDPKDRSHSAWPKDYLAGQRSIDHRDLGSLVSSQDRATDHLDPNDSHTASTMGRMLGAGYIRVLTTGGGDVNLEISRPMTDAQRTLVASAARNADTFTLDVSDPRTGDNIGSFSNYDSPGTSVGSIMRDANTAAAGKTSKRARTITISSGGKRRDDSLNPIIARVRAQLIALVSEHSNRNKYSDDQPRNDHGEWSAGESAMPETGTTKGDVSLPLYRYVPGDTLREGAGYGMHWTHDRKWVEEQAKDEHGFIVTAEHPGYDHVMDWDNPKDRPVMEREIGSYEYRDAVLPEVPIRPGTAMNVRSVEHIDADGNRTVVKESVTKRDVSDEPRDDHGMWTDGGGWTDPGEKPAGGLPAGFDQMTTDQQMDHFRAARIEREKWDTAINRGVALGKISPEDASKRGWVPNLPNGYESVAPLPDTLYHATVASDAVLANGLMTQDELQAAGIKSTGLGGGTTDTISLTTDKAYADRIAETMIESHDVATGKITMDDLAARAQAGGFVNGDEGMAHLYESTAGKGAYDNLLNGETRVTSMNKDFPGMVASEDQMKQTYGDLGWHPDLNGGHVTGGDGQERYTSWLRPSTPDEAQSDRFTAYRSFLLAQSVHGGPTDPVFWNPDPKYYAGLDTSQIGVVEAHPIPGAMGYFVSPAEAEWRTWSGDAVTVSAVKMARSGILKYSDDQARDDHGRWTSGAEGDDLPYGWVRLHDGSLLDNQGHPKNDTDLSRLRGGVQLQSQVAALNASHQGTWYTPSLAVMNPATMGPALQQLGKLQDEFPNATVNQITTRSLNPSRIAEFGPPYLGSENREVIAFNSNRWNNYAPSLGPTTNDWNANPTPEGYATHEFGHAVASSIFGGGLSGNSVSDYVKDLPYVSGYSHKDDQEKFAELFSQAYAPGPHYDDPAPTQLRAYLKDKGVTQ
jgi:hypothetical protein